MELTWHRLGNLTMRGKFEVHMVGIARRGEGDEVRDADINLLCIISRANAFRDFLFFSFFLSPLSLFFSNTHRIYSHVYKWTKENARESERGRREEKCSKG